MSVIANGFRHKLCAECKQKSNVLFDGLCADCELKNYLTLAAEILIPPGTEVTIVIVPDSGNTHCPECLEPYSGPGVCNVCSEGGKYPFGF